MHHPWEIHSFDKILILRFGVTNEFAIMQVIEFMPRPHMCMRFGARKWRNIGRFCFTRSLLSLHQNVILHVVIILFNPLLTNCNYGIALLLNSLAQQLKKFSDISPRKNLWRWCNNLMRCINVKKISFHNSMHFCDYTNKEIPCAINH